jgi:addiction module HigA family antidote
MIPENNLPPVHPGEFLKEILEELGVSQAGFARAIGLSPMRVAHVIKGTRPVTAEMALLFGKAFGQTPQYWINLRRLRSQNDEKATAADSQGLPNWRVRERDAGARMDQ